MALKGGLSVSEARGALRELVDQVVYEDRRVVLNRYGKPAVALVSVEDAELLELLEDKEDLAVVRKILKNPKPVPWNKAKKRLGLA